MDIHAITQWNISMRRSFDSARSKYEHFSHRQYTFMTAQTSDSVKMKMKMKQKLE